MAIAFQCPSGHKLTCSEDRAGTQGKCPKCGATFEVPSPNGRPTGPPPRNPDGKLTDAESAGKSGTAQAMIVFLCPNGHRPNGPATLQGQPGQCPHCGAKFRIPAQDAGSTEDARAEEEENLEDASELEEYEEPSEMEDSYTGPPTGRQSIGFLPPMLDDEDEADLHPLARLFTTLWNEKHHGGVVEVHLGDGVVIVPDWWAERLSLDKHAVFALQTADGMYVMETVPWDGIKRITVRRISELPGGVFE